MKPFLDIFLKIDHDDMPRIERESVASKYWMFIFVAFAVSLISFLLMSIAILRRNGTPPAVAYSVRVKDGQILAETAKEIPITLPRPHQTFKNVSSWLESALDATYSFDFNNFDQKVREAEFYFTSNGYSAYLESLKINKIEQEVKGNKLVISSIVTQEPVMINSGFAGDTEFWRLRVPVLISYFGGQKPVFNSKMMEVLVLAVPTTESPKGLAITEYKMISN